MNDQLNFHTNFTNDPNKREKLYPLFEKIFGIETSLLEDFYNRGLWNDQYVPYTYFDGEQAVANASIFPLDMQINGVRKKCVGIQSVMTDPVYRGRGLMKDLFKKILVDIDKQYEYAFLFTESPSLYTPFGFHVVKQYYFKIEYNHVPFNPPPKMKNLNLFNQEDVNILMNIFPHKEALSKKFAPLTYEHALYFNFYSPNLNQKFYYIKELNTIIVFEVSNGICRVFDIVSETIPAIEELCAFIPFPFHTIEFYFSPDVFMLPHVEEIEYKTENHIMIRGQLLLHGESFMMPLTAEF
ncbi:GNAT family N-acetyltransferase [Heyndrickxia oleronia]|jgi:predicted N-acetyltransferase YhbS|uniref:GNAT family N-acetyltransferase n=1 Tax=Heyndrickxia oleronia TaxID=38875 RepID=UPI00243265CD|nr:GNAT family N-acetyltransferase [Heyndrickxia oleronia]MCI1592140.1 GNAT family N-acetyltransferase [Heyndrickxia oleronia]MCI1615105.1 GNAT family N-acetyltransferase [Heyndrickxia oleronia]MCI1763096.1 GNAT family N-acetyltransferase [Heyndrickxia oleronia]